MVQNPGQRISLHFPFFMYLWHVIKSGSLDREITPCLLANKPSPLVSSPLYIIHNLPWCQGQSERIVMVKGNPGDRKFTDGSKLQMMQSRLNRLYRTIQQYKVQPKLVEEMLWMIPIQGAGDIKTYNRLIRNIVKTCAYSRRVFSVSLWGYVKHNIKKAYFI